MESLIKTLPAILQAGRNSAEVAEAAVIAAWKHVTGEGLRNHAAARQLRANNLVVAVADAVWQKQLQAMAAQLLFRLNAILGQPLVKRLEIVIDAESFDRARLPVTRTKELDEPTENTVSLELWSAANAIRDKQLRKVFLRAATATLRRKQHERGGV